MLFLLFNLPERTDNKKRRGALTESLREPADLSDAGSRSEKAGCAFRARSFNAPG
jgi:hypothetical protein